MAFWGGSKTPLTGRKAIKYGIFMGEPERMHEKCNETAGHNAGNKRTFICFTVVITVYIVLLRKTCGFI